MNPSSRLSQAVPMAMESPFFDAIWLRLSSWAIPTAFIDMTMSFRGAFTAATLLGAQLMGPATAATKTVILPNALHNGPIAEETAIADPAWIDGPKLSTSSNDTSYEWCAKPHVCP
jgi:hypothetical protein